jgi:hypothetical protein
MDIWEDRFVEVCRRHHDLVAVYESPRGRLALLLRQTLVPLGPEHYEWLAETRATARAVIADLRGAGFDGATVVLQWLPFGDVANIVSRWVRRWDGDQARRTQLLAVVDSHLADQRFLDTQAYRAQPSERAASLQPVAAADPIAPGDETAAAPPVLADGRLNDLREWYARMAPCWLAIEPPLRRRLVLQTHAWIAERVLNDTGSEPAPASAGLEHDGVLTRLLQHLVTRDDRATWGPWIELVRVDLQRALTRPPARRTAAWARWLFFIPYSVPTPRRARPRQRRAAAPASA